MNGFVTIRTSQHPCTAVRIMPMVVAIRIVELMGARVRHWTMVNSELTQTALSFTYGTFHSAHTPSFNLFTNPEKSANIKPPSSNHSTCSTSDGPLHRRKPRTPSPVPCPAPRPSNDIADDNSKRTAARWSGRRPSGTSPLPNRCEPDRTGAGRNSSMPESEPSADNRDRERRRGGAGIGSEGWASCCASAG